MSAIFPKWFPSGFRLIDGLKLTSLFNNPQSSTEDSITAFAGGGQASAYQLSANVSRVSVCATNADSVKLPPIKNLNGVALEVINDGAANLAVFPNEATVVHIDGGADGASVTITAAKRADFYAVNNQWYSSGGARQLKGYLAMKRLLLGVLASLSLLLGVSLANAQVQGTSICIVTIDSSSGAAKYNCNTVSSTNPFPTTGVVTGTVTISQFINPYSAVTGPATPISGNAAGTTGAVVGTLAGTAGKTTYICGFNVQAIGGTAAVGPITIAGLIGSSQVYQASASAAGGTVASQTFTPCHPANAANTSITITTTADGTATAVNVNSWGFQQ